MGGAAGRVQAVPPGPTEEPGQGPGQGGHLTTSSITGLGQTGPNTTYDLGVGSPSFRHFGGGTPSLLHLTFWSRNRHLVHRLRGGTQELPPPQPCVTVYTQIS